MNSRSWKVVLVVSLVLNVFLLGAIAGGAYRWYAARDAAAPLATQQRALRFAAQTLSPERQKAFAESLKNGRRDGRQLARECARSASRGIASARRSATGSWRSTPRWLARARPTAACVRKWKAVWRISPRRCRPQERVEFADSLRLRGQWREPQASAKGAGRRGAASSAAASSGLKMFASSDGLCSAARSAVSRRLRRMAAQPTLPPLRSR